MQDDEVNDLIDDSNSAQRMLNAPWIVKQANNGQITYRIIDKFGKSDA